MERRHLTVYLKDEFPIDQILSGKQDHVHNPQIIFALIPNSRGKKMTRMDLFSSAHPVAWKAFYLHDVCVKIDFNLDLGVGLTQKTSNNIIEPIIPYSIPKNHYTGLRFEGATPVWCKPQYTEVNNNAIVIRNSCSIPQSFCICATSTTESDWNPIFSPIIMFNTIKEKDILQLNYSLSLYVYYNTDHKQCQPMGLIPRSAKMIKSWDSSDETLENWSKHTVLNISRDKTGILHIEKENAKRLSERVRVLEEDKEVFRRLQTHSCAAGVMGSGQTNGNGELVLSRPKGENFGDPGPVIGYSDKSNATHAPKVEPGAINLALDSQSTRNYYTINLVLPQ